MSAAISRRLQHLFNQFLKIEPHFARLQHCFAMPFLPSASIEQSTAGLTIENTSRVMPTNYNFEWHLHFWYFANLLQFYLVLHFCLFPLLRVGEFFSFGKINNQYSKICTDENQLLRETVQRENLLNTKLPLSYLDVVPSHWSQGPLW